MNNIFDNFICPQNVNVTMKFTPTSDSVSNLRRIISGYEMLRGFRYVVGALYYLLCKHGLVDISVR